MKRNNFIKSLLGLSLLAPLTTLGRRDGFHNRRIDPYSLLPTPCKAKEEVTFFTPEMLSRNNFGLFIINSKVKQITEKNIGYAATVSWKLCYQHNYWKNNGQEPVEYNRYGKANFLTDGWFCPIGGTYKQVCEYLNNNPYGEKFRLMTKEEVLYIISNRKQGFL